MTLRSTTNLIVDPSLTLPKAELKEGFMYIYNKGYTGKPAVFITRLWGSTLIPSVVNFEGFGKYAKNLKDNVAFFHKHVASGLTTLKKINGADPYFVASVPVYALDPKELDISLTLLRRQFIDPSAQVPLDSSTMGSAGHTVPGDKVVDNIQTLDAKAKHELKKCVLGLREVRHDDALVVMLDLKISSKEAEQLTSTEWASIRNVDLYPLILMWVTTYFGTSGNTPLASFPVSKISRTLPPVQDDQARVDEFNLSIGPDGTPRYLPKVQDNTQRYEDLFQEAGNQEDGSFTLMPPRSNNDLLSTRPKLPKNISVLIDWVNNKYAYTNTMGALTVQDLVRFHKCNAAHATNVLKNTKFDDKQMRHFLGFAHAVNMDDVLHITPEELTEINTLYPRVAARLRNPVTPSAGDYLDVLRTVLAYVNTDDGENYAVFMNEEDRDLRMNRVSGDSVVTRPLHRWLTELYSKVVENLESVYEQYSVATTSLQLGYLSLIVNRNANAAVRRIEDQTIRKAAINQGVDPNWKPDSIPLLRDPDEELPAGIGLLPHQEKVRNILKDGPDFALIPIDAGGGKTLIGITDIALEIKANRNQPYLVLCPPHLVAQYVKELAFFTKGKINIIGINSYSIRKNGFKRLTAMMANMPRNSIVVVNYDVLRWRAQTVCYGTTNVTVFPVIDFLRQFNFGYALLDESHSVKSDTARTRACMTLIADIPKKRLASGTMKPDSPSDLANQVAMLDPTLFGSRSDFNERFGAEVSGERVISWKAGAQKEIDRILKSRIVIAGAKRKEWAALLPHAEEEFHGVVLTDAQYHVYKLIFESTLEAIREAAKTNRKLAEFLEGKQKDGEDEDDDAGEDLSGLLNPYLARLEQYVTAPARDPLGDKMLQGDDRISPKVKKIIDRIRVHLAGDGNGPFPGKVLIFTNYVASAEEIYEQFPPDIKKLALLYVASEKIEAGSRFEKDPNKLVMVGVENSMNTGLNLQFVSRLIRVETIWTPGVLEQGNARVNRPELKKADRRELIWYDWIMADRTIDITKISRLISKLITNAKFDNPDDAEYDTIPEVPVIKMTLDTIAEQNSWSDTLEEYGHAYAKFVAVRDADYAAYKEEHGALSLTPIEQAPDPDDAQVIPDAPYIPGLEVVGESHLGLIRVDEYLRSDTIDEDSDADSDVESLGVKTDDAKAKIQALVDALKGQKIHTELGDGIFKSLRHNNMLITVSFPNGTEAFFRTSAAFLLTKPLPKGKSVKDLQREVVGFKFSAPTAEKANIVVTDKKAAKEAVKMQKQKEIEDKKKAREVKQAALQVELELTVTNGYLGISYWNVDNTEATNALQALGFRPTPPFIYAHVKTAPMLLKQFQLWHKKGFTLGKDKDDMGGKFKDLMQMLQSGRLKSHVSGYNFASRNELRNFYRLEFKPSADSKLIKPYPIIEDGQAYIALPIRGQAGTLPATKVKAAGIVWTKSDPSYVFYGLTPQKISEMVHKILNSGIQIMNIKELRRDFKRIQKLKLRTDE